MQNKVPVLFDVNAAYGRAATGENDCPAIADRLAHMNRLGISRALVWNVESTQNHALSSNDRLLADIARTPGARGRIYPALTVSGLMAYEQDGIRTLKRQMAAGGTRALRFYNALNVQSLRQLPPVMRALSPLKPLLIVPHGMPVEDLLDFAGRHPAVPVILTETMWPGAIKIFELLRRCKNFYLDISWFHTWAGIELAVRHFGARRVVFGMGHLSHNGAAIAALARAGISDADRQLIAHGNLDRLLGLKTSAMAGGDPAKKLWRRMLAGGALGVDCIDAHAHLGPSAGYVLELQTEDLQIPAGKKMMDSLGVKLMIHSGFQALLGDPVAGNDLLARKLQPHAGHYAAYVAFNPLYADELAGRFDGYFRNPLFVGFKTLCDYWRVPITDKRFAPMWQYANRRRLPVLNHTWNGNFDTPAMFDALAKKYPQVSFLLAHSGGGAPGRAEAEILGKRRKNVFLEWCGSFCCKRSWNDTLAAVGARKVVFGTDAMAHDTCWELGRLLSLDAPDRVIQPILGANMRAIMARRR